MGWCSVSFAILHCLDKLQFKKVNISFFVVLFAKLKSIHAKLKFKTKQRAPATTLAFSKKENEKMSNFAWKSTTHFPNIECYLQQIATKMAD